MLKVRLGKIIDHTSKNEQVMEKAFLEFFGNQPIELPPESKEQIFSLFNEWLIFNFKLPLGTTIITEYYLKNPDNLSENLLNELKQIIETQVYDCFEIDKTKPGEWIDVWGLFSGKKYRVSEVSFSINIGSQKGSFFNRIAKVNNEYYFIGSDSFLLPMTYTDRSRRFYSSVKDKEKLTPKIPFEMLLKQTHQKSDPRLSMTKHDIKMKRKKLEKKFEKLKERYDLRVAFQKLVDFVYQESYKDHFADFYKDILTIGIPEKMIVDKLQFFQDLWNYFPHEKLDGKSPADKFKEIYG